MQTTALVLSQQIEELIGGLVIITANWIYKVLEIEEEKR